MSAHNYPLGGYGLYLSEEEAAGLASRWGEQAGIEDCDLVDLSLSIGASRLSCDEPIDGWWVQMLCGDHERLEFPDGLFICSEKQGLPFYADDMLHVIQESLYHTADEMADEFRRRYGGLLPEGFDFVGHLAEMRGSICC